jgi:hypothetical protein
MTELQSGEKSLSFHGTTRFHITLADNALRSLNRLLLITGVEHLALPTQKDFSVKHSRTMSDQAVIPGFHHPRISGKTVS